LGEKTGVGMVLCRKEGGRAKGMRKRIVDFSEKKKDGNIRK
jgi:hypothetical protein